MKRTLLATALLTLAAGAHAEQAGDWVFKIGAHAVDPKSGNGTLAGGTLRADVGSDVKPTFQLEYFFSPNLGLEVLASLPFQHEIKLNGVKAAEAKHLPPTVSMQWHFNPGGKVNPFVGLGLNYTTFFSIKEKGPLAGTNLDLGSSWGPALHAGLDFPINDAWLVSVDARWMSIDTKVKVNGERVGTVHIDPLAYGVAVGYRF